MSKDLWEDYAFILVSEKVSVPTMVNLDKDSSVYMETVSGKKGIVFFPNLDSAKTFMLLNGLRDWAIARIESAPGLIELSINHWGCNIAYSIHLEGDSLRRDSTELLLLPPKDGQHKTSL